MKQYIKAELQIVRVNNNDIVTASQLGIGSNTVNSGTQVQAPGRKSIWDYFALARYSNRARLRLRPVLC